MWTVRLVPLLHIALQPTSYPVTSYSFLNKGIPCAAVGTILMRTVLCWLSKKDRPNAPYTRPKSRYVPSGESSKPPTTVRLHPKSPASAPAKNTVNSALRTTECSSLPLASGFGFNLSLGRFSKKFFPHSHMASMIGFRLSPRLEIEYSTFGGTTG